MLFPVQRQLGVAVLERHAQGAGRGFHDDSGFVGLALGAGVFVPGADHVEHPIAGQGHLPLGLGELVVQVQPALGCFASGLPDVHQVVAGLALLGGAGQEVAADTDLACTARTLGVGMDMTELHKKGVDTPVVTRAGG